MRMAGSGGPGRLIEGLLLTVAVLGLTSVWWLRIGDYALVGHRTDYAFYGVPVLVAVERPSHELARRSGAFVARWRRA